MTERGDFMKGVWIIVSLLTNNTFHLEVDQNLNEFLNKKERNKERKKERKKEGSY